MSKYAKATKGPDYEGVYPGSVITPNAGVIHTTEGTTLPGYSGGAVAPNYTAVPDFRNQRLEWHNHFPDERSSRALVNSSGGVETNTLNVVQIELVGTCDPRTHADWKNRGIQHIYWPEAPDWALDDVADFVADMNKRHGIKIQGPKNWVAYPESYGAGGQRFTFAEWRAFYGWCGHQHVPENVHGDPGAFPWAEVEKRAKAIVAGTHKPAVPHKDADALRKADARKVRMDPANYHDGARGPHVKWLKNRLVLHGFGHNMDASTGFYGPGVKGAVRRFQKAQGWSGKDADGLPGRETLKRLAAKPGKN